VHEVIVNQVREEDWADNWKKFFKPMPIGEKLWICPTWEEAPPADGRALLHIDPGMAFGTGGHETTRLVLETLEKHINGGETMLDVGCGSGILSIAALLHGVASVVGVDIDALAVKTAVENGEINHFCPPRYTIYQGDLVEKITGQYHIVVANIVADAIIGLSGGIKPFLKPDGVYITSGIIDSREQDVMTALDQCGFSVIERHESGGWLCLVCKAV
jgi:ribosomal protein L11 methyltransferase